MHVSSICEKIVSSAQFSKGTSIDFVSNNLFFKGKKNPTIAHLFFNLVLELSWQHNGKMTYGVVSRYAVPTQDKLRIEVTMNYGGENQNGSSDHHQEAFSPKGKGKNSC